MKTSLALVFLCLFSSVKAQSVCPSLGPKILDESVTPLWAQEYIGADLVRDELLKWSPTELKKVPLAIVDLGFEEEHIQLTEPISVPKQRNGNRTMRAHHGTSVANLLTGPTQYRVSDQVSLINLTAVHYSGAYHYMWRNFEKNEVFPKVITNSLGWTDERIPEVVEKAHEKKTLWFLAAGNDFPTPVRGIEKSSKALMIGSFAPSGLTSFETQNDPALIVLAPANEELATINGYGEEHLFGATSGATPLVAGSVINILSFLPNLNRDQVITLIRKSSFKSVENKLGLNQMPGLLNGYKLFKVAQKIFNQCGENTICHNQLINNDQTYIFSRESSVLKCDAVKAMNCEEMNNSLKEMRRRSFLGDKEMMRELSCAYAHLGLNKNSEYFSFLASDEVALDLMEEKANEAHNRAIYQISYYRYGPFYSDQYPDHILASPMKEYHKKSLMNLKREDLSGH